MRRLAAKVFLIFLLTAGTAFSQDFHLYGFSMYNLEFLGSGARARSMGGAFIGIADDASALTWNPAGLIQISKTQASISGIALQLKTENDIKYSVDPLQNVLSDFSEDVVNLSAGSFIAPVRIKGHPFVAAASYQRVIDDNDAVRGKSDDFYSLNTSSIDIPISVAPISHENSTLRALHKYSLGFGTDIYGKLSFGGAVNIYNGNGTANYRANLIDTLPLSDGITVYDTIAVNLSDNTRDEQSLSGMNLLASLMYRTERVRIGVSLSSPFELVTEHDLKRSDSLYVKSIRIAGPGTPLTTRPTLYLGKTKIEVPMILSFGASVQVTPKLLLSGDLDIRSTSSTKYFVRSEESPATSADSINLFTLPGSIYFVDSTETSYYNASGELVEIFNEFELGYESSMQMRFGAEYMVTTGFGTIPLRGGIRIAQLPYRDVSDVYRNSLEQVAPDFVLGEKISQTTFTFGSGIHWSQVWLDFAVEMKKEEQTEKGFSIYDFTVYEYENTRTKTAPSFMMTFTGFF